MSNSNGMNAADPRLMIPPSAGGILEFRSRAE
jgi:hypothetical protein